MQQHTETFDQITEKIREIKVALFKPEINSELMLPNNVIQVLKVDGAGNIWFFTSCTGRQAANINKTFYSYLDFHKRGTDSRLLINGPAFIVDEENDVQELMSQSYYSNTVAPSLVLIKMKIMQAEYFEGHEPQAKASWTQRFMNTINHWFSDENPKKFNFR
ncbi:MAG: pyridoxamine 5'-phosphate oxidase family protein [Ferruginibacter sp.]